MEYGPFKVTVKNETSIQLKVGDKVRIVSEGKLKLGGGVFGIGEPVLDANGDDWPTPVDYPSPLLRKNSLIVKVGSDFYQGGVDATFIVKKTGELILLCNDSAPNDNSDYWTVNITVLRNGIE